GRAAAAAAGHGFMSGWTLAIIGDMAYFVLLMVSTLWLSSIFGDDRLTIGAVLIATWVIPLVIRRLRRTANGARGPRLTPTLAVAPATTATAQLTSGSGGTNGASPTASPARKRTTHNGRRRASRGLHR